MTTSITSAAMAWAQAEFGAAPLGHAKRTARLVRVAAAAAERPGGTITHVCRTGGERQGAYGLLANDAVDDGVIGAAHAAATARRAAAHDAVVVALDDTSVRVADHARAKGTGAIGSGKKRGRGLKVLSALAVSLDGATLGLLDQQYWVRATRVTRDRHQRRFDDKESRHWEHAAAAAARVAAAHAPGTRLWFQKDAGADSAELLLRDLTADRLMTVRAVYDRRVHAQLARVRATLAATDVAGASALAVPAGPGRAARTAQIAVHHAEVVLHLHQRQDGRDWAARVWVVWAREVGTTPAGERPLDWMLYTSYPVADFGDACLVLHAYALRWRLEEFHFTWKSGGCDVTRTELRRLPRLRKWARLLAAVASRIVQLRDASRATPDAPASTHFDAWELRALVALRQPRGAPVDVAALTLGQAVRWVAELGGYTGKSSGGPPGVVVIVRGLIEVLAAAKALRFVAENTK